MTNKELKIKALQTIKKAVDGYANAFDPCDLCDYKENGSHNIEACKTCCYYYPSKFRPREK